MKTLYKLIKAAIGCCIAAFACVSACSVINYLSHPDEFIYYSAPWYIDIEICGIFTGIALVILFAALYFVKRKIGK